MTDKSNSKAPKIFPVAEEKGVIAAEIAHDERITRTMRNELVKADNVDLCVNRLKGIMDAFDGGEDLTDGLDDDPEINSPFMAVVAAADPVDAIVVPDAMDEVSEAISEVPGGEKADVATDAVSGSDRTINPEVVDGDVDDIDLESLVDETAPEVTTLSADDGIAEKGVVGGDRVPPETTSLTFDDPGFTEADEDEMERNAAEARRFMIPASGLEDDEVETSPFKDFTLDDDDAEDPDGYADIDDEDIEDSMNALMDELSGESTKKKDVEQGTDAPDHVVAKAEGKEDIEDGSEVGADSDADTGDATADWLEEIDEASGQVDDWNDPEEGQARNIQEVDVKNKLPEPDEAVDDKLDPFQEIFGDDSDIQTLAAIENGSQEEKQPDAATDDPTSKKRRLVTLLASAAVAVVVIGMGYSFLPTGSQAPVTPTPPSNQVADNADSPEVISSDATDDSGPVSSDEGLIALGVANEPAFQPPVAPISTNIDDLFGRDGDTGDTIDGNTFRLPQDQIEMLASAEDIDTLIEMFRNSEARIAALEEAVTVRDRALADRDEVMLEIAKTAREAEALALATTEIITDVVRLQGSMGTAEELIVDMSQRIAGLELVDPADRATIERRIDDINTRIQGIARDLGLLARLAMEQPGPHQSAQPTAPVPGALSVYEDARGNVAPAPTAEQIPGDVAVGDMIDGYGEVLDVMDTAGGRRLVVMENASVMID